MCKQIPLLRGEFFYYEPYGDGPPEVLKRVWDHQKFHYDTVSCYQKTVPCWVKIVPVF